MHAVYRDHMGNDLEVVNDARVSFGKETTALDWHHITMGNHKHVEIPILESKDVSLINFLARGCSTKDWDNTIDSLVNTMSRDHIDQVLRSVRKMPTHWTPFAHQMIKLNVCAPLPIRTQC